MKMAITAIFLKMGHCARIAINIVVLVVFA
jgi:hypothetical protein